MTRPTSGQTWPRYDIGGDGVTLPFPLSAPTVPSAFDDEFTTDTLDAKWTIDSSMSASGATIDYNFDGTWLKLTVPSSSTQTARNLRVRQAVTGIGVSAPFTLVARLGLSCVDSLSGPEAFIGFADNNTYNSGNGVYLGLDNDGSNRRLGAYTPGFTEATVNLPTGASFVYVGIRRDASGNCDCYYSLDGLGWRLLWAGTGRTFAFSTLWLSLSGGSSGATVNYAHCDFVRVNDTRFSLPSR